MDFSIAINSEPSRYEAYTLESIADNTSILINFFLNYASNKPLKMRLNDIIDEFARSAMIKSRHLTNKSNVLLFENVDKRNIVAKEIARLCLNYKTFISIISTVSFESHVLIHEQNNIIARRKSLITRQIYLEKAEVEFKYVVTFSNNKDYHEKCMSIFDKFQSPAAQYLDVFGKMEEIRFDETGSWILIPGGAAFRNEEDAIHFKLIAD